MTNTIPPTDAWLDEIITQHAKDILIVEADPFGKNVDYVKAGNKAKAAISQHIEEVVRKAEAKAYDNAAYWLNDRLTSKKDVASICTTRAKVLRGEIEAPKPRFANSIGKERS